MIYLSTSERWWSSTIASHKSNAWGEIAAVSRATSSSIRGQLSEFEFESEYESEYSS